MTEEWIHYFDKANYNISPAFEDGEDEKLDRQTICFHDSPNVNWEEVDVVLIGIGDARNTVHKGCDKAPDAVRSVLLGLRALSKELKIVDLGNLRGKTIDDRYKALSDITLSLLNLKVLPIVIGGGQDYTLPLAKGMKQFKNDYQLAIVDSKIDWLSDKYDYSASSFLGFICHDESIAPRDLSMVGVQKYLYSQYQENKIKEATYDIYRLGQLRQHGHVETEPIMRDADLVSVDVTSVKQSDLPGRIVAMPNGLAGEELCQLMWYAGQSDRLKAIGVFELDIELDINHQGCSLVAQAIWHILEGYALRYNDYPVKVLDEYRQFIVFLDDYELEIKFYNNQSNDRWWVEIPTQSDKCEIIACGRSDFETASNNEIPEKWFRYIQKNDL
ncbi:arginase family protein [Carboxylicivirga sp. M1479]|uniref:arginase family protein n=1 Tax=Carboxylicivirga sp. M1479 TaxID=2594476 RepID=UPI0011787897|nr:arginase family protein [Carboxylicivirga sp. M1479]TRX61574.1 hypothetical protein FNN09_20265 [Carboxylicivirga sp. M1479]